MPDQFSEVTTRGWGSNIMESIKGVVFGIILFLASFVVLWINEGRVDMSKVAKMSLPISASVLDSSADGKLVSVAGNLTSSESIGDPRYLQPGRYIKLVREVEMYAWEEEKRSKTTKKVGGGSTTETTYSYQKGWTSHPDNSSRFKYPEGHQNPPLSIQSKSFIVKRAEVGIYDIEPQRITLPRPTDIELTSENVIIKGDERLEGDYIFKGKGSLDNPQIGDMRLSFKAVDNNINATTFGKLEERKIVPFMYKGKYKLYRAIRGGRDEAIARMATEYRVLTWILRVVGFFMMWFGLSLFFGPINAVLDVLPFLGSVGRGLVAIAMFVVAFILSLVTIIVSMIVHNIIALIIVLLAILGGVFYRSQLRKKKTSKLT